MNNSFVIKGNICQTITSNALDLHESAFAVCVDGISKGVFEIEDVNLIADIILYSMKGLEVPYIYDRLGDGLSNEQSKSIVSNILRRVLNKQSSN